MPQHKALSVALEVIGPLNPRSVKNALIELVKTILRPQVHQQSLNLLLEFQLDSDLPPMNGRKLVRDAERDVVATVVMAEATPLCQSFRR